MAKTKRTTVTIHGGDYDCSELVRMCYAAAGVLPSDSYMWTGNEVELLTSHGFAARSLSSPQVGDVLWRDGHTEIYLGNNKMGGARHGDYAGGIDGRKGDQDGTEVTRSAYKAGSWSMLLRYEGGHTCDGIPAAIVAAKVADHIIDDNAHGYSQPNRMGDGTTERVTITWDGSTGTESGEAKADSIWVTCGFDFKALEATNVRSGPEMGSNVTGTLDAGTVIHANAFGQDKDGRIWARYLNNGGKQRYVSLGQGHAHVRVV